MSYELRIAHQAESYVRRLDEHTTRRIFSRLRQIAADPYGLYTKPLTNAAGQRSARVGDWRIVFGVDDASRVVNVAMIAPRGEAYRGL